MKAFTQPLHDLSEYEQIVSDLAGHRTPIHIDGCIDSQKCHLISSIGEPYPVKLIVTYNEIKAKEIYADYFMQLMNQEADFRIDNTRNQEILREIAREGKIDKMVETLRIYLNNLSNRDLIKFDEKYIKLIFYCIAMTMQIYSAKSEMEVNRNYPDILLVPRDRTKGYKAIMVEFKYLKKGDTAKLEDKQKEAREQIERYSEFDDIKDIEGLRKYTIVVAGNELYVEEI